MEILSINSSASGRTAAFVDDSGKVRTKFFPVDATDEDIIQAITNEKKFNLAPAKPAKDKPAKGKGKQK